MGVQTRFGNFFVILVVHLPFFNPLFFSPLVSQLTTYSEPLIQSFVLSALTKLSIKTLPNPIPTSITAIVRQQCQNCTMTTMMSAASSSSSSLATTEVQQRAAEFLMIADLAVSDS